MLLAYASVESRPCHLPPNGDISKSLIIESEQCKGMTRGKTVSRISYVFCKDLKPGENVWERPRRKYTKGWSLHLRHFVELREEGVKENFYKKKKVYI